MWFEGPIEVIPAVDVLGEEAVRLHQGNYDAVVERARIPPRSPGAGPLPARGASTSSTSTAPVRAGCGPSSCAPRLRPGCPCRPPGGSAAWTTRGRCSTQAPTAWSWAPPPGPTRRRGSSSARRSCSRSTCATARCGRRAGPSRPASRSPLHSRHVSDRRVLVDRDRPRRDARRPRPRARRRRRRGRGAGPRRRRRPLAGRRARARRRRRRGRGRRSRPARLTQPFRRRSVPLAGTLFHSARQCSSIGRVWRADVERTPERCGLASAGRPAHGRSTMDAALPFLDSPAWTELRSESRTAPSPGELDAARRAYLRAPPGGSRRKEDTLDETLIGGAADASAAPTLPGSVLRS